MKNYYFIIVMVKIGLGKIISGCLVWGRKFDENGIGVIDVGMRGGC